MEEFINQLLANLPEVVVVSFNIVFGFLVFLYRAKTTKTGSILIQSMQSLRSSAKVDRDEDAEARKMLEKRVKRCEAALQIMLKDKIAYKGGYLNATDITIADTAKADEICVDGTDRGEPEEN